MKALKITLALMLVSLSALAMGGKKHEPSLPSGLVNSVGANAAAQAVDPALAFANWCQARLGRLTTDQAQCVTQLGYRFGKVPRSDTWSSDVKVAPNDTVSVAATGSPKVLIGLSESELSPNGSFVASQDGVLAFSAPAKGKKFAVLQVTVRRCFEQSGKTTLCHEAETTAEDNSRRPLDNKRRKRPASASSPRFAS